MKKTLISFLLSLIAVSTQAHADPQTQQLPALNLSLKPREPNWRADIKKSFANGSPQMIVFYKPQVDGTELPMKQVTFHENGRIESETDLKVVEEGSIAANEWKSVVVPHGVRVEFDSEGRIAKAATYIDGRLEGESRLIHPNGKILASQHFSNGKLNGSVQIFFESGALKETAAYADGELEGDFVQYNEEGQKVAVVPYKKGEAQGLALEWYPSGALKS